MTIFITSYSSQPHKHEVTSTMINKPSTLSKHNTHKQLITLPFVIPILFIIRINQCEQVNPSPIPLLPNIYHKEIHTFYTLNKSLEIHLPQFIEQSLRDFSLPPLLYFQINTIYSNQ